MNKNINQTTNQPANIPARTMTKIEFKMAVLTIIYCAKTSISKLFGGVKMVGGSFKFFIGKEVNTQVGTSLFKFFHRRGIRRV